ncbi:MAG: anti-sigma factor [Granulosicoccus sp.]
MNTEENNWDLQAAEYVLGTLSHDESKVYDALYKVDSDWRRRVHEWQDRLNRLHTSTRPVTPPPHVLRAVLSNINDDSTPHSYSVKSKTTSFTSESSTVGIPLSGTSSPLDYGKSNEDDASASMDFPLVAEQWKERVRYWQLTALVAVALLAGVLFFGPDYLAKRLTSPNMFRTVAVLSGERFEPLWVVSYFPLADVPEIVDAQALISITVVGEPQLSALQSHQLWMVLADGTGVQSVGLLPSRTGETITMPLPIRLTDATEFLVSLEASDAASGKDHGPVVARTYIVEPAAEQNR